MDKSQCSNSLAPEILVKHTCLDGMVLTELLHQTASCNIFRAQESANGKGAVVYEYFPKDLAIRTSLGSVTALEGAQSTFETNRRQFIAAGECLAALKHPALPAVEGIWSKNGTSYVQTAEYAGATLWDYRVQRGIHIPQLVLDQWLQTCADGLTVLSEHGIAHSIPDAQHVLVPESAGAGSLKNLMLPFLCDLNTHSSDNDNDKQWDIYAVASLAYLAVSGRAAPSVSQQRMGAEVPCLVERYAHVYSEQFLRGIADGLSLHNELQLMSASAWIRALGCQNRTPAREGIVLRDIPKRGIAKNAQGSVVPPSSLALSDVALAAETALQASMYAREPIRLPSIRVKPVATPAPARSAGERLLPRRPVRNWRPQLRAAFALVAAGGLFQLAMLTPLPNLPKKESEGSLQTALQTSLAGLNATTRSSEVAIRVAAASSVTESPMSSAAVVAPLPLAPQLVKRKASVRLAFPVKRVREKAALQLALAPSHRSASAQCADMLIRQSLSARAELGLNAVSACQ